MSDLSLRMRDGTQIVVPSSLDSITTYVILEQENWFEKETAFLVHFLRPGMNAIDIGANLGVYSLPIARLVGPAGRVFAYEPASETRRLFELSRQKNQADNLQIIPAAISDGVREGHLVFGTSSELNTLQGSGEGETIQITSLDIESAARNWPAIDFLKIDAEGEEERVFAGGASFFEHHSPLVMFEIKDGQSHHTNLPKTFIQMGYGIYRLLGHEPILVPVGADEQIDGYELNFFAAKPDRAQKLAAEGLLTETISEWSPSGDTRAIGLAAIKAEKFAPAINHLLTDDTVIGSAYCDALAAFAVWRSADLSLPVRCGALQYACEKLTSLCEKEASLARLSTLARVAHEAGRRNTSVLALNHCTEILKQRKGRMFEPFWPASPRFDSIEPGANPIDWFVVAALELFEKTARYSSYYGSSGVDMSVLSKYPTVFAEMERRVALAGARTGRETKVSGRLLVPAEDHVNADVWQAGLVPNTFVRN